MSASLVSHQECLQRISPLERHTRGTEGHHDYGVAARDELAQCGVDTTLEPNPVHFWPVGNALFSRDKGWRLCFKHILKDRWTQGQRYSTVTIICAGNDLLNGTHEAMQQWIADLREWAAHYEVVLRLVDIVGVSCL